ncbi:MAG: AAA family ATPase [Synergistaceae bacterium]|jgi:predicted ATPase|nr:AAA family ATPase [Synergistaceae bacterium]
MEGESAVIEIAEIKRQFGNNLWKKFLNKITLDNLRGWSNQSVEFRFPVCAIAGENGSGKTTVLRAAACAYDNRQESAKKFYPALLFLKTQWDNDSIRNAAITYEITQGDKRIFGKWKKTNDWGYSPKGKRPERQVFFLDISRTLPLDATAGYAKIAKLSSEIIAEDVVISDALLQDFSHIMGGSYSAARFVQPQPKREVGLLTNLSGEISQFHQAAGEDELLDFMRVLDTIPETALLIVDEVEASLHPKAQRRFINFLLKIARQKKLQIILSTHSPYILEELPPEGRILIQKLSNGEKDIQYGVSANYAMGVIDELRHPDLYIYVEDKESAALVREIIDGGEELLGRIEIRHVGSADVVKTLGRLCRQDRLPTSGIAIIDGDVGRDTDDYLALPTDKAPERFVFEDLKGMDWKNLDERFGMGAGNLFSIFDDALTNPDPHKISEYIGNRLHKSKDYVWNIFVEEWCKQCLKPEDKNRIITAVRNALAKVDSK